MIITTFQQTVHPELSATVTEITQDVVYNNFQDWAIACLKNEYYKNGADLRTFKNYYKQGYTPTQAVKKYFL